MKGARIWAVLMAALLTFSTLANDYLVANAEEVITESTDAADESEAVEETTDEDHGGYTLDDVSDVTEEPSGDVTEETPDEETAPGEETSSDEAIEEDSETATEDDSAIEEETEEGTSEEEISEEAEEEEEAEEDLEEEIAEDAEVELSEEAIEFATVTASNGLTVKVFAPAGAFPEGTEVVVTAISNQQATAYAEDALADDQTEVVDAKGVDVTFKFEGEEIEPAKPINVTFANANLEDADDYSLIHVDDNGNTEVVSDADVDQNGAEAELSEFSVYVVSGTVVRISESNRTVTINKGKSITVYISDTSILNGTWNSDNNSVATVSNPSSYNNYRPQITITGVGNGQTNVKYSYRNNNNNKTVTIKVTVEAIKSKLTFNKNGGSQNAPGEQTKEEGTKYTLPNYTGTKEDYVFGGWNTSADGSGTTYAAGSEYTFGDTNVTLFAKWDPDGKVKATFVSGATKAANEIKAEPGEQITLPACTTTKSGYTFAGWSLNGKTYKAGAKYKMTDANVEFSAVWSRAITFNVNGGNGTAPEKILANIGDEVVLPDYTGTKSGFVFVGWSTINNANDNKQYTTPVYPARAVYTMQDANVTLYATWSKESEDGDFFIRYDGVIPYEPSPYNTNLYTDGIHIANAVKVGVFTSNNDGDGVKSNLNSWPTDEQIKSKYSSYNPETQYVLWYVIKRESTWHIDGVLLDKALVNLAYQSNAPTGKASNIPAGSQHGVGITATISSQVPTRTDGYTFTGWNTEADGTGNHYSPSGFITMDQSYTLYAQWENNNQVVITAASDSKKYDGSELTAPRLASTTGLPEGYTVEAVVSGGITDAGSAENVITSYVIKDESGKNVTNDFRNVKTVNGTLTVSKREVTLTSATAEKEYDGTALTNTVITIGGDKFVSGEGATFTVSGTQTAPGYSDNTFTYDFNANTKKDNYIITKTEGVLTVTKNSTPIVIKANSNSKKYDGTPLTDAGYTYTEGVLKEGDVLTAVVDGSQTDAGSSANKVKSYKVMRGTKDVTLAYSFGTPVDGTLTVTKRNITLTSATDSKTYDGTPLTNSTVTVSGDGFVSGDGVTNTVTGTITNQGSVPNTFTYKLNNDTMDGNYNIIKNEGTLTITKKGDVVVTITGNSDTKYYNGTEQSVTGYTVTSISSDLYTEKDFTFGKTEAIAKGTTVGNYPMGLTAADFTNTNDNFEKVTFVVNDGKLEIKPVETPIVITADSETKTYDGSALTNAGYTYTQNVLANGDTLTATVEGTITNVGTVANKVTGYVVKHGETDVTANYTFGTSVDGTLTVTKRNVTLTSATDSKTYDGTALTKSTVTGDGFVTGEGATYNVTGSQTDVGNSKNTFEYTLNKGTEAGNYNITKVEGTLTVTPITTPITITANSNSKKYDGTALTDNGYTYTQDVLVEGDVLTAVVTGTITNVGTGANVVTSYKVMRGSTDVTANYTFANTVNGKLEVTKRTVTLTSATDSKTYDGKPLTNSTVTVTGDGFVAGEGATYSVTGSQTDVGSSDNAFEYTLNRNTNADNYTINEVEGKLTVTKITTAIIITAASDSKKYDGSAITNSGYTYTEGVLVTGDVLTVQVSGGQTDAGSSANTVTSYVVKRDGKDVTANYNFGASVNGTLTVTKRNVTLTSASDSKIYNGTPLTNDTVTVTGDGFVSGDGVTNTVTGTITNQGSVPNAFTYTLNDGTKADNYNITKNEGTLTITKRGNVVVTINGNRDTKYYNGSEQSVIGYTIDTIIPSLYTEKDFTFTKTEAIAKGTTVGNYPMGLTAADFTNTNDNFENVTFVVNDGNLEIKPVETPIVITAASDSKTYDGSALTNAGYTYTQNVLANGDTLTATVEGTITNVGTVENKVTGYVVKHGETDVTANYTFGTSVDGTLTVNKRNVTLTSATDSKTYDGTALTNSTVTVTGDGFVTGEGATYNVTGSQTDVGDSKNAFGYTLNAGTVAGNYNITEVEGTLTVNPITTPITITANSNSKKYDGTALTDNGYTYTQDVLVEGDVLTAVVTGTIKNVGTSANVVTSYKVMRGSTDVTANYTFADTVNGKLEVTKRTVTLTSATDSKTYDGKPLTNSTVTVTGDGFVAGEGATYSVTGSQTDKGTSDNTFNYELNAGTLTNNYEITKVVGKLTVNAIDTAIVITADSETKTYDGSALTKGTYTYTEDVLVDGDVLTAVVSGGQTDVGYSANTVTSYVVKRGDTVVTDNYTFGNSVPGTLTVTQREVTLTSASDSKTYDGKPLTNSTVTVSGDGFVAGEGATYEVTGSQTYKGTSKNKFTYALADGTKADNYKITLVEGDLTVTAIETPIEIKADSNQKVYDGTALTDDGYTYTENVLVNGDVLTAVVEGTITDVGETNNVVTSYKVMNGTTEVTANYTFGTSVNGKLEVTPREVTLTSASDSKTYDGTPLVNKNVTPVGFVEGEGAIYNVTGSQTYKGTSKNTFTYELAEGTKAGNYSITTVEGDLTVNAIETPIEIKANSKNKVYDGIALTDDGYTYTNDIVVEGDELTAVVEGTVTNVSDGKVANKVTEYKVMRGDVDTTENYTFTKVVDGELYITPAPYEVITESAEKVYDGDPLTADGEITGIVEGETVTLTTTGEQTEVGFSDNTYEIKWDGTAVESNYKLDKETLGVLTVTEYEGEIIVTTIGGVYVYDGLDHGAAVSIALGTPAVEPEEIKPLATATFNDEGSVLPKGYSVKLAASSAKATHVAEGVVNATADQLVIENASGKDVTSKLNITYVDDTIEVTPAALTVTTKSATKVYDGTPLTAGGSMSGLVADEKATLKITGSQTELGGSKNTYTLKFDKTAAESDYTVTSKLGTLVVVAEEVTPGEDPTPTPGEDPTPTPTPTPVNIDNEATPLADAAAVLGAQRGIEADDSSVLGARRTTEDAAVLGARRDANTQDENNIALYLMLMGVATGVGAAYATGRRRKHEK